MPYDATRGAGTHESPAPKSMQNVYSADVQASPTRRRPVPQAGATPSAAPSPARYDAAGVAPSEALSRTAAGRSLNPADALQPWEKEILQSPEVQRKATLAQICT